MPFVAAVLLVVGSVAPSGRSFDHSAYDALLRLHVADGLVDYAAFKAAPRFRSYLEALGRTDPQGLPEAEQLAFWINAYNAHTIALVNASGVTDSIRSVPAPAGSANGPWSIEVATIGGRRYSLDQIEHQVIRPRFQESRVHFALVCAALGCPPLRAEAYAGDRLTSQLDAQARSFILDNPTRNRVDLATGRVYLSPIFDWFRADFGGDDASILRFVARYQPPGPSRALLLAGRPPIVWTPYDWRLNARRVP